jgi:1-acyl-sn-glycerol-3-phosphate acyltransferase
MLTYIKAFLIIIYGLLIATLSILVSFFNYKGKAVHKIFSKGVLAIAGVKLEIYGSELLDKKENYIFISNHQSYFDIPVLMQAVPNNIRFIYRKSLSQIPIFGWAMYLSGYIPINRDNARKALKSLRKAAEKIKKGISIVIFPEGTRSTEEKLGEFKRGMFVIAEEAKVKLVPVTINGSRKILPKQKFIINSGKVIVTFNKPIEFRDDRSILNEIREIIKANLNSEA